MSETAIPVIEPTPKRVGYTKAMREAKRRTATQRTSAEAGYAGVGHVQEHAEAAPIREVEAAERLTRAPRAQRDIGEWTFPPHRRRRDMDYQLIVMKIYNEPQSTAEYVRQHWTPVPVSEAPELLVPGEPSQFLDVRGLRWHWRPKYLSEQAKQEDLGVALQQQKDKMLSAASGKPGGDGPALSDVAGVRPFSFDTQFYAEAGSAPERKRSG